MAIELRNCSDTGTYPCGPCACVPKNITVVASGFGGCGCIPTGNPPCIEGNEGSECFASVSFGVSGSTFYFPNCCNGVNEVDYNYEPSYDFFVNANNSYDTYYPGIIPGSCYISGELFVLYLILNGDNWTFLLTNYNGVAWIEFSGANLTNGETYSISSPCGSPALGGSRTTVGSFNGSITFSW